jgi:hypothetical protein
MPRRRSLSSSLYRLARAERTAEVIASGDPRRIRRRVQNKLVGKSLGKAGVWARLWGGRR